MIRRTFLKIAIGTVGAVTLPLPAAEEIPAETDLRKIAQGLRQKKGLVVGVLEDPRLNHPNVPASLNWEHFRETWGALPDVHVVPLNRDAIRSYSILFRGHMDILVYPYGSTYPMDAFSIYTGDAVLGFLKRGGAILTTGGVPFGNPVDDNGKSPSGDPGLTPNADVYRRWVAPLGFKYYQHPLTPPVLKADAAFLPSFPADSQLHGAPIGIVVNNSSHDPVPKPYHGNVFPERYPARQVTPLLWGADKLGGTLATNAVLVQDFEDGSRRLHFSHTEDAHPLAPGSAWFTGLMGDLFALLKNRVAVKDVSTSYACYRDGEPVTVRAELVSFEPSDSTVDVQVEIRARESGAIADSHRETIAIPARRTAFAAWEWKPARFDEDDYVVTISVVRDGRTVARGKNGFLVWKDEVVKAAPAVAINGTYFNRSDGETFMLGTNYYESTRGEIMWFRPDVDRISADLRSMRACGVSYIRPHYHHFKWFKDYLLFQHQKLLPYFDRLEKVTDPFPDEAAWRTFDAFIYLCQKLGIAYGGDLFTLVPEEMGDPRGWFPMTEALVSEEPRAKAMEFFRRINDRYKNVPCILWDLWNEPGVDAGLLTKWTQEMRTCLTGLPLRRYITVGSAPDLGDALDFVALHIGCGDIRNFASLANKPVIAQEVYLDRPEDLASEQDQSRLMRLGILSSVKVGLAGFAPWSWTRQMRLWQDSYEHDPDFRMESWDDRLGCQVHDDGTLKIAGRVFKDLSVLLKSISFSKYDTTAKTLKTSRGQVTVDLDKGGGTLLHFDGDHCFAATGVGSVAWKGAPLASGPDESNLYIFCPQDDLLSAKKVYFKSDAPGKVQFFRQPMPASLALVELQPGVEQKLADLKADADGNALAVTTEPGQEAYWIAASW